MAVPLMCWVVRSAAQRMLMFVLGAAPPMGSPAAENSPSGSPSSLGGSPAHASTPGMSGSMSPTMPRPVSRPV